MSKRTILAAALALTALVVALPNSASAQLGQSYGCSSGMYAQGYGFGAGFGYGAFARSYNNSFHNQIPYFALHPPVYYSDQIVARPYGISPFAAPPGIRPIEMDYMAVDEAKLIENPFYEDKPEAAPEAGPAEADQQASFGSGNTQLNHANANSRVKVIVNPYFVDRSMLTGK